MCCKQIILTAAGIMVTSAAFADQPGYFYPAFGHRHASTVYEGWARGQAYLIQSVGQYQLMLSQAHCLDQEARSTAHQRRTTSALSRPMQQQPVQPAERDDNEPGIHWPVVLEEDVHARSRRQIELQFTQWARYGVSPETTARTRRELKRMLAQLKRQSDLDPDDVQIARQFIRSLGEEIARRPSELNLAQR
jgi:hypothetical protein